MAGTYAFQAYKIAPASQDTQFLPADANRIWMSVGSQTNSNLLILSPQMQPSLNGGIVINLPNVLFLKREDIGDIITYAWYGYAPFGFGTYEMLTVSYQP